MDDQFTVLQEFLARKGLKLTTPLFRPKGMAAGNWEASVALISGLFAKEAIVGTLQGLYPAAADISGSLGGNRIS